MGSKVQYELRLERNGKSVLRRCAVSFLLGHIHVFQRGLILQTKLRTLTCKDTFKKKIDFQLF